MTLPSLLAEPGRVDEPHAASEYSSAGHRRRRYATFSRHVERAAAED